MAIKNDEKTSRFKRGFMRILRRESRKRGNNKKRHSLRPNGFAAEFSIKCYGAQARATRRGPPGSTIIILKELVRFNNKKNLIHGPPRFLPSRSSSWRGLPPPLRGGNHGPKSLLLSPYPAIPPYAVRTSHPGPTDDRAHKI